MYRNPSTVEQAILERLSVTGVASSLELQRAAGASQPTVSRALRRLAATGGTVASVGKGKQRRYVALREVTGHTPQQPLRFITESGASVDWGTLSFASGGRIQVEGVGYSGDASTELPWFLAPLRPEGYLARAVAQASQGSLPDNPERWTTDQALDAVLRFTPEMPGAFELGERYATVPPLAGTSSAKRLMHYDLRADEAATRPARSSAGGEQPKFLVSVVAELGSDDRALLVKFTPPRGTPFGERWHDLLHAEALALHTLAANGHPAAQCQVLQSERRTYLESVRFDRVGLLGKRHVVPLHAIHRAFVPGPQRHWAATAQALHAGGRLTAADAQRVQVWKWFGDLIGNHDMHFGNLSLQAHLNKGQRIAHLMTLAPCYDMLPMRWSPQATDGNTHYSPLVLNPPEPRERALPAWQEAQRLALTFWQALAQHTAVSTEMREAATVMADRVYELPPD